MKDLLKFFKPYISLLLLTFVFIYIQVQVDLALPGYLSKIVNDGIVGEDKGLIWSTGGQMLLISLVGGIFTVLVSFLVAKISAGVSRDMRNKLFSHIETFSLKELNHFSISSLITRSTNDIQQIQTVLSTFLRLIIWAPILGLGAVVKAYATAPSMSWILALGVFIIFFTMSITFVFVIPKFKIVQKTLDKLNLVARENLTGLRVIRAFSREHESVKKFDMVNVELTKVNILVNRMMIALQPMMFMVFNFVTVAIIWFGSHLIATNDLQIGEMMAFLQYAMLVIFAFLMLSIIFITVPRASVSMDRVSEVLKLSGSIAEKDKTRELESSEVAEVRFENVSFAYSENAEPVLKNISFIANKGETTAFIGSTGSGKSTLINLIPRFFDVVKGSIYINDIDIRALSLHHLHNLIGYTPQKATLFSGSIASNIRYGDLDLSDSDIRKYAQIAEAADFIEELPQKYETDMAQGGSNFSGGQKQRISIARAISKNRAIYIFDDTFSALDFKTGGRLRANLAKTMSNKTVLIVAQRIATVMHADKIIVLDKGQIVCEGKHGDLLKTCKIYREIALSQLSEKELDLK